LLKRITNHCFGWSLLNGPPHVRRDAAEFMAAGDAVAAQNDEAGPCDGSDRRRGPRGAELLGLEGPVVVTLLLEKVQKGAVSATAAFSMCLGSAEPEMRLYGALALPAYDRNTAIAHLVGELRNPEEWVRSRASRILLELGDSRGIQGLIDQLEDL
jgi:hypothetical protein